MIPWEWVGIGVILGVVLSTITVVAALIVLVIEPSKAIRDWARRLQ